MYPTIISYVQYNHTDHEVCRNWEFEVPHPAMIDLSEATIDLDRDDPLVCMLYDGVVRAFIHKSIHTKARNIGDTQWDFIETSFDEDIFEVLPPYPNNQLSVKGLTEWVKKIKYASWHSKEPKKVRVMIPKI